MSAFLLMHTCITNNYKRLHTLKVDQSNYNQHQAKIGR